MRRHSAAMWSGPSAHSRSCAGPTRSPSGYSVCDTPLVGLPDRIAKHFRLICRFHEVDNGCVYGLNGQPAS